MTMGKLWGWGGGTGDGGGDRRWEPGSKLGWEVYARWEKRGQEAGWKQWKPRKIGENFTALRNILQ